MDLSVKHLRDLFGGNIPVAQVLQGVASGMADCGVNVVIDPNTPAPYAVPAEKKIVLPAHVRSEKALLIVSWHVDHEVGHIIYSPPYLPTIERWLQDSKMLSICKDRGYPKARIDFEDGLFFDTEMPGSILHAAKFFHNMCEDARIEQLMVSRWPGVKKHFIGGPIAAGCELLVEDTLKAAEEKMEVEGLDHIPISPFFVAMVHAHGLMGGKLGQQDRDYVRELMPEHVEWVLDLAEDEFANVNAAVITFEEIADKVDTVVANILDKLLPEHQEQPQQGGGQGEGDEESDQGKPSGQSGQGGGGPTAPNPLDDKIDPDNEPKGKPQPGGKEDGHDEGGSEEDAGSGGESDSDGEESGSSSGSGDEDDSGGDESDSGSSGKGGKGQSSDDSGNESGGDDSDSGDDDSDSDESGEKESGSTGSDGESDSDSDDEGEDDGSGSGECDDVEDSDEDQGSDADSDGDKKLDSEDDAVTGEINCKALPKQVEEWAKEAHVDLSALIRGSGETGADPGGAGQGDASGATTSGAPTQMKHAEDIAGMPDEYLARLAPGARVIVIRDNDLSLLFDEKNQTFQQYDNFIRGLMPQNLGPAARKLLGRFKGAPGAAWSGTRINPKMLQPIVSGNAYGRRLYLRRNEPIQSRKGVCVMVAIDCSGSMCESVSGLSLKAGRNSKFSVSHAAARGIARLLQTVNVPFGVMGFLATSMKYGTRSWSASRHCDIVNFLFKDFHEPWTACEQRMLAMNPNTSVNYKGTHICPHTNSDGESLLWGAMQIITREESRKIMIVISDGLPYAGDNHLQSQFLKWAVRRIETAGIKIGGLGLGDDGVRHYYRLYELIESFPPGMGTDFMAPLYIQEKILSLIDRLTMEKD